MVMPTTTLGLDILKDMRVYALMNDQKAFVNICTDGKEDNPRPTLFVNKIFVETVARGFGIHSVDITEKAEHIFPANVVFVMGDAIGFKSVGAMKEWITREFHKRYKTLLPPWNLCPFFLHPPEGVDCVGCEKTCREVLKEPERRIVLPGEKG